MKINQQNSKTKLILLSSAVAIIVISGGIFTYIYALHGNLFGWTATQETQNQPSQPLPNLNKPTAEQQKAGDNIKQDNVNNDSKPNTSHSDSPAKQPQTGSVDVVITAATQNGNVFQLRALISAVENSGTCTLTLTRGQQTVTKTADIQALSTTSTCKGFDVATSELSPGLWKADLTYKGTSVIGTASKNITIQ